MHDTTARQSYSYINLTVTHNTNTYCSSLYILLRLQCYISLAIDIDPSMYVWSRDDRPLPDRHFLCTAYAAAAFSS